MTIKTHYFESTGSAYDAAMCWDEIETGDVLVVKRERVVGLADAWPVAVTVRHGQMHHVLDGLTLVAYGFTPESVEAALVAARDLGFPLNQPE